MTWTESRIMSYPERRLRRKLVSQVSIELRVWSGYGLSVRVICVAIAALKSTLMASHFLLVSTVRACHPRIPAARGLWNSCLVLHPLWQTCFRIDLRQVGGDFYRLIDCRNLLDRQ